VLTLQLSTESAVRVEVLDVAGRHVRTLAAGRLGSGAREISFDGRDDAGRDLPPGVYRVRARVGDAESARTIIRIQ
jgi:flagellar basal-body rod modification protein FlgD